MKAVLCLVFLSLGCVLADMAGECNMVGFYQELGCTPVFKSDNLTCPEVYTCPDLHPDRSMCYYKGVAFADRASIPQKRIENLCTPGCTCQAIDGKAYFKCANVECFDTINTEQCISIRELGSCCSKGSVCGKDAIAKLKTCDFEGNTYHEGQMFSPKNTRKVCICTADWDGRLDNTSNCYDENCGLELYYQDMLADNCAPMFYGDDFRCPIGFQCPSAKTKVVRGVNVRGIDEQCIFGNETMAVGDEVLVEKKCTKCSCEVPPFVTCRTHAYECL